MNFIHFAMIHFLVLSLILSHCSVHSLPIKLGGETLPDAGFTQDLNLISDPIHSMSDVIGTDMEELQSGKKRTEDFLRKRSNYVVDVKNMDADKDISSISHASLESWGQFDEIDTSERRKELPLEINQLNHDNWEVPPLMFEMDEDVESSKGVPPSDSTERTPFINSDGQSESSKGDSGIFLGSHPSGKRDSRSGLNRFQSMHNNQLPTRIGIPSGLPGEEGIGYLPNYLTQYPTKRPNDLPAASNSHTSTESQQLMFEMDDISGEAEESKGVKSNDYTARASSGNSNSRAKSSYEVSDSITSNIFDDNLNRETDSRGSLNGAQESANNELQALNGLLGYKDDFLDDSMKSHNDVEGQKYSKKSELSRLMEEMARKDSEESLLQDQGNSAAKPNIIPAESVRPLEQKSSNNADVKVVERSELSRLLQQVAIQGRPRANSFQNSLKLPTLPSTTKR